MALNNIGNEPQRELIEQGFGILTFFLISTVPVLTGVMVHHYCPPGDVHGLGGWFASIILGTIGLVLGLIVLYGFIRITHALGEQALAITKDLGWDPRPKVRYATSWLERRRSKGGGRPYSVPLVHGGRHSRYRSAERDDQP